MEKIDVIKEGCLSQFHSQVCVCVCIYVMCFHAGEIWCSKRYHKMQKRNKKQRRSQNVNKMAKDEKYFHTKMHW